MTIIFFLSFDRFRFALSPLYHISIVYLLAFVYTDPIIEICMYCYFFQVVFSTVAGIFVLLTLDRLPFPISYMSLILIIHLVETLKNSELDIGNSKFRAQSYMHMSLIIHSL
jgi:hypothetical protein